MSSQPRIPFKHYLHSGYAHPVTRSWQGDTTILKSQLIYPIFVTDQQNTKTEIKSLPGNYQISVDLVVDFLKPLVEKGLKSIILFGVIINAQDKNGHGSLASDDKSPVCLAIRLLKVAFPQLCIACDVCLCAYTHHGHCGVLVSDDEPVIDNEKSVERLAAMSLAFAKAGAHIIAPSDMMDGRIAAIKTILHAEGYGSRVAVMAYSSKFASCFYGPFRDAAGSGAKFGDRSAYQLPAASRQLAKRAAIRDAEEGADFVMVKPAGPYLDIVREVKDAVDVPVCCYQVSGEYAMLYHAAAAGGIDLKQGVLESLICLQRAGCDIFITYFTPLLLDWLPL
ncbi:delta-aminolevulinate dehydratase [Cavenderia fasciculata]|uniref:Delta-aminolevulinic acid dehydratase n=1 Tax=Cavenderia fasciculata TaxID=261658 RepID=F4PQL3_CACFS|nr:delta-aminolevulinate dehydratase [Cavenderia fasciculata]EGG21180.1 delta-aminolevulinate dehydratase [Cavenderia fasciculata]|eukprot:XP_004359030.1 delta-aminolevulinate dehydratase [Cavenderia fasciculata]